MSWDAIFWLILGALALVLEGTGLLGLHGFRPLTKIIRGEMKRSTAVTGAVAAFLLWLVFHFLVQTYLPPANAAAVEPLLQVDGQMYAPISSQAQAVTLAETHSVIVRPGKYVAAMKAANPGVVTLDYVNGMFDNTGNLSYPASWYLHDAAGGLVKSVGYGNILMDGRDPGWQEHVASVCRQEVAGNHADGCFVDMLGPAPLSSGYNQGHVVPVDPQTGQPFTKASYMQMTLGDGEAIQADAGVPVMGNGIGSGGEYPYTHVLTALHVGALAEVWMRSAGHSPGLFPSESQWQADEQAAAGDHVTVMTKLWTKATSAQIEQWRRYTWTSFLLARTSGLYEFSPSRTGSLMDDSPLYHQPIGQPTGTMQRLASGAYERAYTGGVVITNPTGSGVQADGRFVPAHDGVVVTP